MELQLAQKIVNKVKDYALQIWLHNWGESLLHKDFVEIFHCVKSSRLKTVLSTNLNIEYNRDLFYSLVEAPLDRLIVSLDGLTQETYSKYRVGGSLKRVFDNIRQLSIIKKEKNSRYPEIVLQFLEHKYNYHEVSKLKHTYRQIGADSFFVGDLILFFKCNDLSLAKEWLTDVEISKREFLDVDLWTLEKVCPFLYRFMFFEQDGSIPPCCYTTEYKDDFGSFDDSKSINDLFNTSSFINARRLFKDVDACHCESYLVCRHCSVYNSYKSKLARS